MWESSALTTMPSVKNILFRSVPSETPLQRDTSMRQAQISIISLGGRQVRSLDPLKDANKNKSIHHMGRVYTDEVFGESQEVHVRIKNYLFWH